MSERVTIGDLAREPARAATLPLDAVPDLLADVGRVHGLLLARLVTGNGNGAHAPAPPAEPEHLLSAAEVAERFRVTTKWCFRHAAQMGGLRLSRKRLRFTEAGVRRYLTKVSHT
jgi:hypothetical protein